MTVCNSFFTSPLPEKIKKEVAQLELKTHLCRHGYSLECLAGISHFGSAASGLTIRSTIRFQAYIEAFFPAHLPKLSTTSIFYYPLTSLMIFRNAT